MTFRCHLQARGWVCIPPLLPPSPPGAHSILGATGRVGCGFLHCLDAAKLCCLKVPPPRGCQGPWVRFLITPPQDLPARLFL